MYYLKIDLDISKLKIQKEELTEVKWFSIEALNDMVEKNELNKDQVEFFEKCMWYVNSLKQ